MANLLHIVEGWSKSFGLLGISKEERERSVARMKVCATSGPDGSMCEKAKQSSFLKVIHGKGHQMGSIFCNGCGCPVNEKSLVKNEKCPLGRWDKLQE